MSRKFAKISTHKSQFRNPKYIKNVLVHSLRTSDLDDQKTDFSEEKLRLFYKKALKNDSSHIFVRFPERKPSKPDLTQIDAN